MMEKISAYNEVSFLSRVCLRSNGTLIGYVILANTKLEKQSTIPNQ